MKTSDNNKLTLKKMTVTILKNPHTIKGGGSGKNDTYTVRITTITNPDTGS